ncbi:hypothetical protein TrST_g684 [Triparma strigata]|uniref:Uncharacterized protein n=1 Tax=Triparma strigata TaxID=1606541 RepID=A0A9W7A7T2_9STRA|nr:hypothetical protein TrST_g684 [Triparma strigata]
MSTHAPSDSNTIQKNAHTLSVINNDEKISTPPTTASILEGLLSSTASPLPPPSPSPSPSSIVSTETFGTFVFKASSDPLSPIMTPEPMEVEAEEEYDDRYCYKERYERYESYESLEERRMQDGREVLSYDAMIVDPRTPSPPSPPSPPSLPSPISNLLKSALFLPLRTSLTCPLPPFYSPVKSITEGESDPPSPQSVITYALSKASSDRLHLYALMKYLEESEEEEVRRGGLELLREYSEVA